MAFTKEEKATREEYYLKVFDIVKEFGAWSVDCAELARKWNLPHKTVWNWKMRAEKEIGAIDIKSIGESVKNQMEANLRLAHNAVRKAAKKVSGKDNPTADDIKTLALMLKAYNDTVSKHTEFAERWGYKAVIAQKLEVAAGESEAERLARIVRELDEQGKPGEPGEMEEEEGEDFAENDRPGQNAIPEGKK